MYIGYFAAAPNLTAGVMAAGMLFSWILPHTLIGLFTTQESTVSIGVTALHYISFGFIVSAVSITVSGVLEGLGKGSQSPACVSRTLSDHYCSGSISLKPDLWCKGRVDGFCHRRIYHGRLRDGAVSQGGVG